MNFWQEILAHPRDIYAKLSRGQRMGVMALAAVGIVVAALAALLGGRQSYAALCSGLDVSETNEIVKKLTEVGIPYQLSFDGSLVQVPDAQLADARVQLATAGLPRTGAAGWSLFDGNQLAVSDKLFDVNVTRALAGELENAIRRFPAIKDARVFLHLADPPLILKDRTRSTASVQLVARPGVQLDDGQVAAIAHLVTGVGHGLAPEDVKITDARMNLLHPRADAKDPMASMAGLQRQQSIERALEQKAESQLALAYGEGRATVRVSVELDPNYRERASETVNDENKVAVKSHTTREGSGAQKPKPGDLTTEEQNQYREGVIRELEIVAAGQVKRMSVSLFVDQALLEAGADGGKAAADAAELEAAVKQAVGFVESKDGKPGTRNDTFKLVRAPFTRPPAEAEAAGSFGIADLLPLAGNLAEALTVVIVLFMLTRALRGPKAKAPPAKAAPKAVAGTDGAAAPAAARSAKSEAAGGEEAVDELQELVLGESRGVDVRTRLARFVQHYPEQAREVLVAWLKDEVAA
jgi:flagellar M-ring protein FliF